MHWSISSVSCVELYTTGALWKKCCNTHWQCAIFWRGIRWEFHPILGLGMLCNLTATREVSMWLKKQFIFSVRCRPMSMGIAFATLFECVRCQLCAAYEWMINYRLFLLFLSSLKCSTIDLTLCSLWSEKIKSEMCKTNTSIKCHSIDGSKWGTLASTLWTIMKVSTAQRTSSQCIVTWPH